jgi:hypothetical protein
MNGQLSLNSRLTTVFFRSVPLNHPSRYSHPRWGATILAISVAISMVGAIAGGVARADERPAWNRTISGCLVWGGARQENARLTFSWDGQCRHGRATGEGTLVIQNAAGAELTRYEGELKHGKEDGHGVVTGNGNAYGRNQGANHLRYDGEWTNGFPNGPGLLVIDQNGQDTTYKGIWSNGCLRQGTRWIAIARPFSSCPYPYP